MADITKCEGKNCKLKKDCYRYTAISSPFVQAWSDFDEKQIEGEEYPFLWRKEK